MDEFDILEKAFTEFNMKTEKEESENLTTKKSSICSPKSLSSDSETEECSHSELVEENGTRSCTLCGIEITKEVSYEKEWRYYGADDTKHTSDPNRCHARKSEEKNIYKDVENMGFSDKVVDLANQIYLQTTKDKIYRGKSRKAIVYACIFNAFKILGKPQSCEALRNVFQLDRKVILKGLKHVSLNAPKNSEIRTKYITAIEIINEIMNKFNANTDQKKEVFSIYEQVKNRSVIINRSKPQSVASGIIYYYITSNKKDIDIKTFTKTVNLSELTVNKVSKEIQKILEPTTVPQKSVES